MSLSFFVCMTADEFDFLWYSHRLLLITAFVTFHTGSHITRFISKNLKHATKNLSICDNRQTYSSRLHLCATQVIAPGLKQNTQGPMDAQCPSGNDPDIRIGVGLSQIPKLCYVRFRNI